jgi:hypothetical protein
MQRRRSRPRARPREVSNPSSRRLNPRREKNVSCVLGRQAIGEEGRRGLGSELGCPRDLGFHLSWTEIEGDDNERMRLPLTTGPRTDPVPGVMESTEGCGSAKKNTTDPMAVVKSGGEFLL